MNKKKNTFDAIVVGSGISGGWAAKELTEKGLKVLLLERGEDVDPNKDFHTALKHPWEFEDRTLRLSSEELKKRPVQGSHCDASDAHFFVNDLDHPYEQNDAFKWIRGYQMGGRSLTWGRQCYRLTDLDFEANKKDGIAVDWPIRYRDIEPYYDYVESYMGISGDRDGISHLPDGKFEEAFPLNTIEKHLKQKVEEQYESTHVIASRVANLRTGKEGRGACLARNRCSRGCPFGGYFNSLSFTLDDAKKTGNLTIRSNAIVSRVVYEPEGKRASGVEVIDSVTLEKSQFFAKVIFLNASTIATAQILLNSTSDHFPNGMGNSSDQLGRNLMDHCMNAGTQGEYIGYDDLYYKGRTPGSLYIPRFQNLKNVNDESFVRGYGLQGKGFREGWKDQLMKKGFGKEYKAQLRKPGPWKVFLIGRGETLPNPDNRVQLSDKKDKWGMPLVQISFKYGTNEESLMESMTAKSEEILRNAGFQNISSYKTNPTPGSAVHEMGTARMGRDSSTSVLNENNQLHDVPNVYVTDGSCMTSSAWQNPSLTYMALTVRACVHASKTYFNQ